MKLYDRSGNLIKIRDKQKIKQYIDKLKTISAKNPTKEFDNKLNSLLTSETFSSLLTEGELSSRRDIRKIFSEKKTNESDINNMIKNFLLAFKFVLDGQNISISNIFTLYNLLSKNVIDQEDELTDGKMFREEDVYISSNKMAGDYKGFKASSIKTSINNLISFLKDESEDIYFRAILGHLYFEMIHPYYDYNGRTGRFLPLWLFSNEGKRDEMLYFATAIGNYRDQYLSIFRKNINIKTYEANIDKMVIDLVRLLILNQYQYIWLKKTETKYTDSYKKTFNNFQKNFIWLLMKKSEISNSTDSWFKLTKEDKDFIDVDMRQATMSEGIKLLKANNIIETTNEKPKRYKLLNYKLFNIEEI